MHKKLDLNILIDITETVGRDLNTPVLQNIYQNKTKAIDYKILKTLAKGGYGEVFIAEKKGEIYALKRVSKASVKQNSNSAFFMNEKEIMTTTKSEWLVKAYECIQDEVYLYYIMEFVSGGDLMAYLANADVITEKQMQFYAAEIIQAIHELHEMGFIHRDLKPDNILIAEDGHIKLGDFGSSAELIDGKACSELPVGTPDYVCVDLLQGEYNEYGAGVDYWALGIILYEMAYGETPFYENILKDTYARIKSIDFKRLKTASPELNDLLERLICPKDNRLDWTSIRSHPFFNGINWDDLKSHTPPFFPKIKGSGDISNFLDTEFRPDTSKIKGGYSEFIGFTFDPTYSRSFAFLFDQLINELAPIVGNENSPFNEMEKLNISNQLSQELSTSYCNQRNIKNSSDDTIPTTEIHLIEKMNSENRKQLETEYNEMISSKMLEIDDLNLTIEDLKQEKEQKSQEIEDVRSNLKKSINDLLLKRDEVESTISEILIKKGELNNIKSDISEKNRLLGEMKDPKANLAILESLKDLRKTVDRLHFYEELKEIQSTAYWFYKETENLRNEIIIQNESLSDDKNIEDLKKQLRTFKTEIREYQQRIEQDIVTRKKLEEELVFYKKSLKDVHVAVKQSFRLINLQTNKDVDVFIENNCLRFNNTEYVLNSIYIRELKPSEHHHLTYKRRALCLKIFFLKEISAAKSSNTQRRSLRSLEIELANEQNILKGLLNLMNILSGSPLDELHQQKIGSEKKIGFLQLEIEKARNSTLTEFEIDDDEKVYEFNNHIFYKKTVAKGTLCDHCNEVLYGFVDQAFCCKDCLTVVHKSCYVLLQTSCELTKAIKNGTDVTVVCQSIEDKERLLGVQKFI